MSDLFKNSEHLKLNHHNYMSWRNYIRADLLAVDDYEIAIGNEQYPVGTQLHFALSNTTFENASERG